MRLLKLWFLVMFVVLGVTTGVVEAQMVQGAVTFSFVDDSGTPMPGGDDAVCVEIYIGTYLIGSGPAANVATYDLDAGDYTFFVSTACNGATNYHPMGYPSAPTRDLAEPVTITAGESLDLTMVLGESATLSGSLSLPDTDLVGPCTTIFDAASGRLVRAAQSNDISGQFSIKVPYGSYLVAGWCSFSTYTNVWYGDTPFAMDATVVTVAAGETRSGIDITLTIGGSDLFFGPRMLESNEPVAACHELYDEQDLLRTASGPGAPMPAIPWGDWIIKTVPCDGLEFDAEYSGNSSTIEKATSFTLSETVDTRDAVFLSTADQRCQGFLPTMLGTSGNDDLIGTQGKDVISALAGDDTVDGADGNDIICGNDGDDTIVGGDGNDLLLGGDGKDDIHGGNGRDRLRGNRGRDVLHGGPGRDGLLGGRGPDSASYRTSSGPVMIDLSAKTAAGSDASGDLLKSIESLTGSAHDDVLRGDNRKNTLIGLAGDDQLFGGGNIDRIKGGPGNDTGDGGDGSDLCATLEQLTSC